MPAKYPSDFVGKAIPLDCLPNGHPIRGPFIMSSWYANWFTRLPMGLPTSVFVLAIKTALYVVQSDATLSTSDFMREVTSLIYLALLAAFVLNFAIASGPNRR